MLKALNAYEYLFGALPECPECGDNQVEFLGPENPAREFGPGEPAKFRCHVAECGLEFTAIVPEPPDGYEGDGVFADNH